MDSVTPETCPHRANARRVDDSEIATCSLVQAVAGWTGEPVLEVPRGACDACCQSYQPTLRDINPVIASLLYQLGEQVIEAGGTDKCDLDAAKTLCERAEKALPAVAPAEDDSEDIGQKDYAHLSNVTVAAICDHLPIPADSPADQVKTWEVGVTTAPRRLPTLERCAESIIKAGWPDPILFVDGKVELPPNLAHLRTCTRRPAIGAFPNFALSLAELYMRNPFADAYMMIQDDALLLETPATREYLERALWMTKGPCLASLYCSTKYSRDVPGWHLFEEPWVWGAVAFVFSRDAVRAFLSCANWIEHRALPDDEGLVRIDILIGQFAEQHGIPVHFPSPSLVQHIGTVSTIWEDSRAVYSRRANQFLGDLIDP